MHVCTLATACSCQHVVLQHLDPCFMTPTVAHIFRLIAHRGYKRLSGQAPAVTKPCGCCMLYFSLFLQGSPPAFIRTPVTKVCVLEVQLLAQKMDCRHELLCTQEPHVCLKSAAAAGALVLVFYDEIKLLLEKHF